MEKQRNENFDSMNECDAFLVGSIQNPTLQNFLFVLMDGLI